MANKVVLVDANIFLAYENIRDTHHTRAQELFQKIQIGIYGTWFITDYIFNEVVGVTFRKFGKERAIAVGESMLKSMILLNIDDHHLQEAWKLFTRIPSRLNFVDCTHLVAMEIASTDMIATFDAEFKNIKNIKIIY